uniref:Uncharacterized protein n=1 Tax=Rhizophora mucronata TaxID=61149 RepID=A0A2P2PWZ9_RHIMU
MYKRKICWTHL